MKTPNNILLGHGCPKCSFEKMGKEKTKSTEDFIKDAKKIHGDKYDYSLIKEYKNSESKLPVICKKHGKFLVSPNNHLRGCGCPKCANEKIKKEKTMSTSTFVKKAKEIFGNDKYDYQKTDLEKRREDGKVCITCPKHGDFWQMPSSHLQGNGCRKCFSESMPKKYNNEEIIKIFNDKHNGKYSYEKTDYRGATEKVCINCPEHGYFWQLPFAHMSGQGCPKCANNQKIDTKEFIKRSIQKHGNKYDYSDAEYVNNRVKIKIICHEKDSNGLEHGAFYTSPHSHMQGSGCPKCKQNYRLENEVRLLLATNEIEFEEKKIFDGLKRDLPLRPDFYLPKYNIVIECQGEQHFKPVNFSGKGKEWSENIFKLNQERDNIKRKYFKEHDILLLEYTHCKETKGENLIKTKEKLMERILEHGRRN